MHDRYLMIGVMMSYKTLHDLPTRWAPIFPKKEFLKYIFTPYERCLNTIHYADYEEREMIESLDRVMAYGGENLHAIQLDMVWPNAARLHLFRKKYPDVRIVLQIGDIALRAVQYHHGASCTAI